MKTKRYTHVTGLYGDSGENPGALAVHAVLDPNPNYPEAGRIIVGSPATTPTIAGHIANLGGFNGGPAAIERLAATLNEAARDVRAAMGAKLAERPSAGKIDLDDLERKARPIAEWDEERDAEEQQCVGCKSSVHTPPDLDPSPLCNQCAQAYVGETAPVAIALITRIRELEEAVGRAAAYLHTPGPPDPRDVQDVIEGDLRELLAKGPVLP